MRWTAAEVAAASGGEVVSGDPGTALVGVGTDSRRLTGRVLWVALRAARDGHDFAGDALGAGAAGLLVEAGHPVTEALSGQRPPAAVVAVADTSRALLDLGRAARARLDCPVIGITGSVGKTSTKDLLAAALREQWHVAASEQSFNNELGVPLTLCNAPDDTEVAVIEMGTRGFGHIALLCDVARPTIGVVTAVAAVHTELLGSLDGVFRAKSELPEALPGEGTAVLNADDHRVAAMADRTPAKVLRYSASGSPGADVTASEVALGDDLRPRFVLESPWGRAEVRLNARGVHQVGNSLAAAAAALVCGTPLEAAVAGLERGSPSRWRMELARAPRGAMVLNDAYNSNPASLAAALRALASVPARRRVAVQ
jgi:UDP-N-acetylmuramoyl-tripeptide--D-alanyl-D-alanine ligase